MHAAFAPANAPSSRYAIFGEIAAGGMATIQYARAVAAGGFSRAVVIKRLHPQFAKDPAFVAMFLDEARLASRIAHTNVVPTLDVLSGPDELAVVMEYVHGESFARLLRKASERGEGIPARIAVTLIAGVLHGLHAAHETTDDHGEPLHIVHRDVSPENVLVGSDGVPRLIDFGIARAHGRSRMTPAGELKGKLAYMAVEQYRGVEVDRRVDVYAASVVLWEALTGRELFAGDSDAAVVSAVMQQAVEPPSALRPELPAALDDIVMRGLARERDARFATAREMALALERQVGVVPQSQVSDWLEHEAGDVLAQRAAMLRGQGAPRAFLAIDDGPAGTRLIRPPPETAADDACAESVPSPPALRQRSGMRAIHPRRRALIAGAMTLAVLAAGGALYLARSGSGAEGVAHEGQSPSSAPLSEPTQAPAVASPTPDPTPAVTAPPAVTRVPTDGQTPPTREQASPPAEPERTEAPERGARPTRRSTPPASRAASAAPAPSPVERRARRERKRAEPDCSNPFVVDERGIRRARAECL